MENIWLQNSKNNLLPLSQASDFKSALQEWVYTGVFNDLETSEERCHLCEHPNIRYQFEIKNRCNNHTLLIGSECIKKFSILSIDENGFILDKERSIIKLNHDKNQLKNKNKQKQLINKLVELSQIDDKFDIQKFIHYFNERQAFTPKQLFLLIWRFEEFKIAYNPKLFKMIIRRDREKVQLQTMAHWKIQKLLPMMTPNQKIWLYKNTSFRENNK